MRRLLLKSISYNDSLSDIFVKVHSGARIFKKYKNGNLPIHAPFHIAVRRARLKIAAPLLDRAAVHTVPA